MEKIYYKSLWGDIFPPIFMALLGLMCWIHWTWTVPLWGRLLLGLEMGICVAVLIYGVVKHKYEWANILGPLSLVILGVIFLFAPQRTPALWERILGTVICVTVAALMIYDQVKFVREMKRRGCKVRWHRP
jgi:Na+/citrate or Na+/malate symporter